jgi:hypothetical protein
MTSSGIESTTPRIVAEFLNQLRYRTPLKHNSNIKFLGSRERSVHKASNLTAICQLIV